MIWSAFVNASGNVMACLGQGRDSRREEQEQPNRERIKTERHSGKRERDTYLYAGELGSVPPLGLSRVYEFTSVPTQELEIVPPLGGAFHTTRDTFWCQFVLLCFLALAQLVTSFFLVIIFPKNFPLFEKPFFRKNGENVLIKHNKIVVFEGCLFVEHFKKSGSLIAN